MRRSWPTSARDFWRDYQWFVLALLALAAVGLGIDGFRRHFDAVEEPASGSHLLYLALQLFTLESGSVSPPLNWELDVARFLAPAVAVYAAAKAVAAVFEEEVQLLRARFWRGHVVVCGLGERGVLLATRFRERGERVVAIERDEDGDGIEPCRETGVVVVIGDATDERVLRKARVPWARHLIAVGGDDGVNAEVAVDAGELVAASPAGELEAFVHVVDMRLCALVRENESGARRSDSYRLRFFNVYESGMRAWLTEYPPFGEEGDGAHLVVVGVGAMGTSLVVGAVRNWLTLHPETALRGQKGPRITLVDRAAERKRDWLHVRHPQLKELCELDAQEMDIASPEFEQADFLSSTNRLTVSAIYICLDDDSLGLKAGLTLLQRVREQSVPVVVRMKQEAGLATLVRGGRGSNLHAFGLLDRTCTPEALLGQTSTEILARAIHEEYVRDQEARGETRESNPAIVPWSDLSERLKESNRRQADHAAVKLRAIGWDIVPQGSQDGRGASFSPSDIELMAEMEHDRWMAERLFEGWTHAPKTKDLERLTSPHLVPWTNLDEEVKDYDRNTVRGLPGFLAQAGFQVRPRSRDR